jgi:ABC-type sugar transport systems, permease components
MDELAGLRDSAPPTINSDPKSRELASKTDFITRFSGPSNPGCEFDHWPAGYREKIQNVFITDDTFITSKKTFKQSNIQISGEAENILTSFQFTLKNYIKIFTNPEFFFVLKTTFLYTLLGTLGSLFLGLFAAQLLNQNFAGRGFLRVLFLLPLCITQ